MSLLATWGCRDQPQMRQLWSRFGALVHQVNSLLGYLAALLIVFSTAAITFEVVARYVFRNPHDWNLELNIFLLVGSTFLAAAATQMRRGHVGIEVLDEVLPAHWNRWRRLLSDLLSLVFSTIVTFYIWKYFYQAWDGDWVTDSTWGPKEWIPYALMGVGITALDLQFLVQIGDDLLFPKQHATQPALGD